ncbi:O-GlcNAc transferase [Bacteroidota bacterium]|nr:O-GlcNAc transferase [Bacteroidota bacterium]
MRRGGKNQQQQNSSLQKWIWLAAILLITYFSFAPSLENDWTNWDDPEYVLQNPMIINPASTTTDILTKPVSYNYHPLTMLSLKWNYAAVKTNPHAYHLTNVVLHLINTALVFFFILMLSESLVMAVFVSAVFSIHPMHVESVTWIAERKDVLYVLFFMLGMICYLKYLEGKKIMWMIITVTVFILSCLSKAMAVVFPIVLLLIDYLKNREWSWKMVMEKIPPLIISLIVGIAAYQIQSKGAIASSESATFFQRIIFGCYGGWCYVLKFFLPIHLSAFYAYPIENGGSVSIFYYLAPVAWIAVTAIVFFFFRKNKPVIFGLLFFFITIVLVLQFIAVGSAITADRYSYLSYIGLAYIVGWLLKQFFIRENSLYKFRMAASGVTVLFILLLAYQTNGRTKIWKNSETLWTDVIEKDSTSFRAFEHRGDYYEKINEPDKAIADYNIALVIAPDFFPVIVARGNIFYKTGNYALALADFNKAIALNKNAADMYLNRGLVFNAQQKYELALKDFDRVIAIKPDNADAYVSRGSVYYILGKTELAFSDFNKAVTVHPDYWLGYLNRGIYFDNTNEDEKALSDFEKGIQLNPNSHQLHATLAQTYAKLQKNEEALGEFSKAIDLNPAVADYWFNRAQLERALGKNELANADEIKAQQLGLK